tara:strand:+ start:282 stop:533 length:252 start_codon:yes stop_codon:yes gene_type:complete
MLTVQIGDLISLEHTTSEPSSITFVYKIVSNDYSRDDMIYADFSKIYQAEAGRLHAAGLPGLSWMRRWSVEQRFILVGRIDNA